MKRLFIYLVLAVITCPAGKSAPTIIRAARVPTAQIIDASHFQRRSKDEIETVIVHQTRGAGLLTFYLNGQPIAKLGRGEGIRLYLSPGRYRFGVASSHYSGGTGFWQTNADISRNTHQIYRIFQSAGFTSSGGNAVYEISRFKSHSR
jgi:hypothetical protein